MAGQKHRGHNEMGERRRRTPNGKADLSEIFRAEAAGHIDTLRAGITRLDADGEAWKDIQHAAHTLKGAAGVVGRTDMRASAADLEALAKRQSPEPEARTEANQILTKLQALLDTKPPDKKNLSDADHFADPGPRVRVFVADDSATFCTAMVTLLESDPGMEAVGDCGEAKRAAELIATCRPDVGLIDVNMPVAGGKWLLAEIAKSSPGTRAIVVAGESGDLAQKTALEADALAFVVKGISGPNLLSVIREHAPVLPANLDI